MLLFASVILFLVGARAGKSRQEPNFIPGLQVGGVMREDGKDGRSDMGVLVERGLCLDSQKFLNLSRALGI